MQPLRSPKAVGTEAAQCLHSLFRHIDQYPLDSMSAAFLFFYAIMGRHYQALSSIFPYSKYYSGGDGGGYAQKALPADSFYILIVSAVFSLVLHLLDIEKLYLHFQLNLVRLPIKESNPLTRRSRFSQCLCVPGATDIVFSTMGLLSSTQILADSAYVALTGFNPLPTPFLCRFLYILSFSFLCGIFVYRFSWKFSWLLPLSCGPLHSLSRKASFKLTLPISPFFLPWQEAEGVIFLWYC